MDPVFADPVSETPNSRRLGGGVLFEEEAGGGQGPGGYLRRGRGWGLNIFFDSGIPTKIVSSPPIWPIRA